MLVAAGGGVVGALPIGGDLTLAMKALAPGMMVMGIIFFMGTISGAHLNPAVTLAFAARGNFPWIRVPGYIVAQIIGGILAALFLQWAYGGILNGATEPGAGISDGTAALTEAILTLGLVSVILGTAAGARNVGVNGAIAVGAYIGLVSVWGAPVSGASMNPGRSFAPMLVGGEPRPLLGLSRRPDRRRADRGAVRVHPSRPADEGGRRGGPGHPRRELDRHLIDHIRLKEAQRGWPDQDRASERRGAEGTRQVVTRASDALQPHRVGAGRGPARPGLPSGGAERVP